jgi:putative NADH-flavin reductase
MRVIVFGASGATGRQLVGQALADGHQITAFVRNVSRLDTRSGQLTVVVGNVAHGSVVSQILSANLEISRVFGARTQPFRSYPTACSIFSFTRKEFT